MGQILDLVIGLALIFFLFSMLVSALQELLASWLNWRGQMLQESLLRLLDGVVPSRQGSIWARIWSLLLEKFWNKRRFDLPPGSLAGAVLEHGLVLALARGERLPAYLPSGVVADALVDIFRRMAGENAPTGDGIRWAIDHLPPRSPATALRAILIAAAGDVARFRSGLVDWYEAQMERVSGWYTRETRYFLLLLGLLTAICFNVDILNVTKAIREQPALLSKLVDEATNRVREGAENQTSPNLSKIFAEIKELSLPIGWPADNLCRRTDSPYISGAAEDLLCTKGSAFAADKVPLAVFGWLLTAIAVSLGAPFWFDIMSRLVNLRAAGSPATTASQAVAPSAKAATMPPWTPTSGTSPAPGDDLVADAFESALLSPDELHLLQQKVGALATGVLDAQTRVKIRDFQRSRGLTVDGRVSPELVHAVLS